MITLNLNQSQTLTDAINAEEQRQRVKSSLFRSNMINGVGTFFSTILGVMPATAYAKTPDLANALKPAGIEYRVGNSDYDQAKPAATAQAKPQAKPAVQAKKEEKVPIIPAIRVEYNDQKKSLSEGSSLDIIADSVMIRPNSIRFVNYLGKEVSKDTDYAIAVNGKYIPGKDGRKKIFKDLLDFKAEGIKPGDNLTVEVLLEDGPTGNITRSSTVINLRLQDYATQQAPCGACPETTVAPPVATPQNPPRVAPPKSTGKTGQQENNPKYAGRVSAGIAGNNGSLESVSCKMEDYDGMGFVGKLVVSSLDSKPFGLARLSFDAAVLTDSEGKVADISLQRKSTYFNAGADVVYRNIIASVAASTRKTEASSSVDSRYGELMQPFKLNTVSFGGGVGYNSEDTSVIGRIMYTMGKGSIGPRSGIYDDRKMTDESLSGPTLSVSLDQKLGKKVEVSADASYSNLKNSGRSFRVKPTDVSGNLRYSFKKTKGSWFAEGSLALKSLNATVHDYFKTKGSDLIYSLSIGKKW